MNMINSFRPGNLNSAKLIALFFAGLLLVSSCKKGEVETLAPPPAPVGEINNDDYVPVYPNTDAVFVSIKHVTFEDNSGLPTEKTTGGARAVFPSKAGEFVNAGDVACQNTPLNCSTGNNYGYLPSSLAPEGISFPNNKLRWSVSGNSNIPNMNFINTDGFPVISPFLNNPETIDRSQQFILGLTENIQNADSVRYVISATNGYIYADDWAVNHSATFSPAKLKALAAGDAIIKITAFRTVAMYINDRMIRAVNQTVISKKVKLL